MSKGAGIRHACSVLAAVTLVVSLVWSAPARAGGFAGCVTEAAEQYFAAKQTFEAGLRNLVVKRDADFRPLADINRALQVAMAEARKQRYRYLLAHDPARIITDQGVSRFANHDWSESDERNFAAEDPAYARQAEHVAALAGQNNGHPDWPGLRELFQSEISRSGEFVELMVKLSAKHDEVEKLLASCRRE